MIALKKIVSLVFVCSWVFSGQPHIVSLLAVKLNQHDHEHQLFIVQNAGHFDIVLDHADEHDHERVDAIPLHQTPEPHGSALSTSFDARTHSHVIHLFPDYGSSLSSKQCQSRDSVKVVAITVSVAKNSHTPLLVFKAPRSPPQFKASLYALRTVVLLV